MVDPYNTALSGIYRTTAAADADAVAARCHRLRVKLEEEASHGNLGVVAARARVPEFQLANCCTDPRCSSLTRREFAAVEDVLFPNHNLEF